ncbi:TRAM domain-containing protein, partial [Brucella sp. 21LCYQ03]|nr:TRAM domain-containing protein [Brucella sp. 21LCYQ03]
MGKRIPQDKKFVSDIEIIDIAEEGRGVAKQDELVMFIEKAIPGDIVDVELLRKKKNLVEGKVTAVKTPSPHRVEPFC